MEETSSSEHANVPPYFGILAAPLMQLDILRLQIKIRSLLLRVNLTTWNKVNDILMRYAKIHDLNRMM